MHTRRKFLTRSLALGCTAAASPLVTPVTFASAPGDARLVVIVLRGAMDGLDVVRPIGDPAFGGLRPSLDPTNSLDLNGFFALHPALDDLMPLWHAGELSFAHATSTPYRDKRSHFDGQDLLEAGLPNVTSTLRESGWMNRMLQSVPGVTAQTAYAIGRSDMRLMQGAAEVANWSPDAGLDLSPQAVRLMELVTESDPAMHAALSEARVLAAAGQEMSSNGRAPSHVEIAEFAAQRLSQEARIAAFSLNGWDTLLCHDRFLCRALERLAETLVTLKDKTGFCKQDEGVINTHIIADI